MPRAVPAAVRVAILKRDRCGESATEIANAFELSTRTVRHLLQQLREFGTAAVHPDYSHCGRHREPDNRRLRQQTQKLREQHPRWGAGRLRIELTQRFPKDPIPSERTLQRWLQDEGASPAPAGRPKRERHGRSKQIHEVWEVDVAEQKRLATGKMISWMRVVEECAGAALMTSVFSRRTFQPRPAADGSKAFPPVFYGVGHACSHSCRQRIAVGFVGRSAARSGVVAHRPGDRSALESAQYSAGQWRRGTFPGSGEELGRTRPISQCWLPATADQQGRPYSARGISEYQRSAADDGVSGTEAHRPALQLELGTTAMGFFSRLHSVVGVRRASSRRPLRKDRRVPPQVVCGRAAQRPQCLPATGSGPHGMGGQRCLRPSTSPLTCRNPDTATSPPSPCLTRPLKRRQTLCRNFSANSCRVSRLTGKTLCRN